MWTADVRDIRRTEDKSWQTASVVCGPAVVSRPAVCCDDECVYCVSGSADHDPLYTTATMPHTQRNIGIVIIIISIIMFVY